MSFPNMSPAPFNSPNISVPKAYTINGTDERLRRTLATSAPGTLKFTFSMWIKPASYVGGFFELFMVHDGTINNNIVGLVTASGDKVTFVQNVGGATAIDEQTVSITPDIPTTTWTHILINYDSSQGTAANRLQFYVNGTLITDDAFDSPTASQAHTMFTNGRLFVMGADELAGGDFSSGKMAFIDVIDGAQLDPTNFAFNNSGTWTRKKFVGSYGTYGFCLDGSDGFNDIGPNAQHFTGVNMDATNISNADMPPFTN